MFEFLSGLGPLPFFTMGPWEIGPLKIHSFGLMVACGVLFGHTTVMHRVKKLGYNEDAARSLYMYAFICGFVFAHVFNVLLYHPSDLLTNPAVLLEINGSLSSYGGFFGGLIGLMIWRLRHPNIDSAPLVNSAFFSLPVGWFFGRLGCSLVHDHPGEVTDFFLAVDYGTHAPGGIRHDLGLYEFIWWTVILITFFALDKVKGDALRKPFGFWPPMLMIMYTPVRFSLDFLRVPVELGGDTRYFGLTPAQIFSAIGFVLGIVLMKRWVDKRNAMKAEEAAAPKEIPEDPKPSKAKDSPKPSAKKPEKKKAAAKPEEKVEKAAPKEAATPSADEPAEEVSSEKEDATAEETSDKETAESKPDEKPVPAPKTTQEKTTKPRSKKKKKKRR